MTDLPEPEYPAGSEGMLGENCYTATQMREYRNQALEEAAKVCGNLSNDDAPIAHQYIEGSSDRRVWNEATTDCEEAILALKEKK